MPVKHTTIDGYLAAVRDDQRAALERLRKIVRAAVPAAEECINYGVPAFRVKGKSLVGFGASAKHCSFYPMSGKTVYDHRADLKGFATTKGAILFQPDKPLPVALVRKLVKSRLSAINAPPAARAKKPTARAARVAAKPAGRPKA
jgi:uncharacterized protein YdhG (YjbR/CyaY superfamily)